MGLLSRSFETTLSEAHEHVKVYRGCTDKTWAAMGIPQGGYVLGLILDALIRSQSTTTHADPLQLMAHFLKFVEQGPFEVHVQVLRQGTAFTNLTTTLVQKGQERVTALAIFGTLSPTSQDKRDLTVVPPSPFAAPFPLHSHPSQCVRMLEKPRWDFLPHLDIVRDQYYTDRLKTQKPSLKLGHYLTLKDEKDCITTQSLPFFADNYMSFAHLTMARNKVDPTKFRPATLSLSIEFKFPIPKADSHYASRTVAVLNEGKFVNDPFARHETYLEVWTAPANVNDTAGWRQHQRCLAICHQMSMIIPLRALTNVKVKADVKL